VDQLIQSGEKDEKTLELETPFLGVPFTIKDCFSVTGIEVICHKHCIIFQ
jgi:fatty acid amide hydrolase 2